MRTLHTISKSLAMASLVALAACSGPAGNRCNEPAPEPTSESKTAAVKSMLKRMPRILVKDDKSGKYLRIENGGFTFSNSGSGFNFSNPASGYQYVGGANGGTIYISSSAFGANAAGSQAGGGGGVVVAGPSSLNINYTFCFAADGDAIGLNLFDLDNGGPDINGVAGVLGVSGDFSRLQEGGNIDEDEVGNIFHGLASYIVYDNEARGNYPIVNWLSAGEDGVEADDLRDKGFAFVVDFDNGRIFFSERGQLSVSGGTITYNGSYLMAEMSEDNENLRVSSVAGVGSMGCN